MRHAAGSLITVGIVIAAAFGAGLAGGYVYSHNPQPQRIEVRVDTSNPPDAEQVLPGTIGAVDGTSVEVTTVLGAETVRLDGVIVEELEPLDEALPASGAPANLGGTRSDSGYVLSGVVVMDSAP